MLCCNRTNLSKKGINLFLRFLRSILPFQNKIPKTYDSILKLMTVTEQTEKSVCNFCLQPSKTSTCLSKTCIENERKSKKIFKQPAKIHTLNYLNQIEEVFIKNFYSIEDYKSK